MMPDAAAHPLQMSQELRRQFVTKNQIHLPREQQIADTKEAKACGMNI